MSGQAEWQKQLTFSDRLAKAYREAHPDNESSEATKYAKLEETTCRKNSSTLSEYHTNCAKAIGRLLATASHRPNEVEDQTTEPEETDSPTHGTQIGPYINATHWKEGISSTIYRAKDPKNNTTVALKVTTPSTMTAPHDSLREARILNASKNSTIIPLLASFQQHDRFVLVFPFMPHDLSTLLHKTPQPLPPQTAKPLLQSLFTGLAHLHSRGILHRDIKPSNILLRTHCGPAYIADFGTAWSPIDIASEPAAAKHLEVGTTSYRPPELLFGKTDYGPKLDMWAAGCVAAQVLGLGKKTLFEAGDLGSELALVKSIFETLGTPDLGVWPEAASLPDWGKMRFTKYPRKAWEEILPGVKDEERDLVSKLVVYESGDRLSAEEALRHPYFNDM